MTRYLEIRRFTASDGAPIRYGVRRPEGPATAGTALLLQGRAEFLEKYRETAADLARRGFEVFAPEWRGQGLSARTTADRRKGHISSFDEYVADLSEFMERIVAPESPSPPLILAHSMGAHIAFRYLAAGGTAAGMVAVAPMLGIHTVPFPDRLARIIARKAAASGLGEEWAVTQGPWRSIPFALNRLTSDRRRYRTERRCFRETPELALGGVTYGWVNAAFTSMETLFRPETAGRVSIPVLMVGAGRESVVSNRAQARFARLLPRCRRVVIPGARHEVLRERDEFRSSFWRLFDDFCQREIRPREEPGGGTS